MLDLQFFIEFFDHLTNSNKIGLRFPSRLIDAPTNPFDKILMFSIFGESFVEDFLDSVHFFI